MTKRSHARKRTSQAVTLTCSICGTSNTHGAHFCRCCGVSITYASAQMASINGTGVCKQCHQPHAMPARFCDHCGGRLPGAIQPAPPTPDTAPSVRPARRQQFEAIKPATPSVAATPPAAPAKDVIQTARDVAKPVPGESQTLRQRTGRRLVLPAGVAAVAVAALVVSLYRPAPDAPAYAGMAAHPGPASRTAYPLPETMPAVTAARPSNDATPASAGGDLPAVPAPVAVTAASVSPSPVNSPAVSPASDAKIAGDAAFADEPGGKSSPSAPLAPSIPAPVRPALPVSSGPSVAAIEPAWEIREKPPLPLLEFKSVIPIDPQSR